MADFPIDKIMGEIVGEENIDKGISALLEGKKLKINKNKKKNVFSKKVQVESFEEIQPLFYDTTGNFWLWCDSDTKWKRVDEVDVLNMIEDFTGQDTISSKNKNELLNALKQEGRRRIPKDIKPTWIQFKDKFYDILTGEVIDVTPKYFATNPIPHITHPEGFEETPTMDKIFKEWVGEKHVQTLYEIISYCLIPNYPIHRIFCFYGAGLNGKSCFLELLRRFLGQDNCCSTELDTLMLSRFEVTRLYRKLVCQMGETNFNEMNKTSMLKKLSGGDLIGMEFKNKNHFEAKNYAKIIISTNNLPPTSDKTLGFYRRWLIIDFPNRFSEKVDILNKIPEEEYQSLALKSLIILKDLLKKREFKNEGTIEQRIERYESKSNFLEQFLKEFTIEDPDGYITKADFYKRFIGWSKENKHRELSEHSVGSKIKKLGIDNGRKYFSWMFDGKGGHARCWIGIKWKE